MKTLSSMNLKNRAVIATASILLLVLAFNTLINIYSATSRYKEALIATTAALAEGIKKDITKAVGFGLPLNALDGMGDKLRSLAEEDKDLSQAMIMDMDGRVLYSSNKTTESTVLNDEPAKRALAATAPMVHSYSDIRGSHYEQVIPLMSIDGKKIGVFRIALKESAVNRQIRSLLMSSLVVGVISFLVALALVNLFVDRQITRPITDMSKTATLMAAGDLSREITVTGKSEIAALGSAINTMSSNLREMLGKIKQTGSSLGDATKLMTGATFKMGEGAKVQQEATEQTAMIVNEMTASIKGVAENAGEMSQAATDVSSSASEMASSVEEVAKNAGVLSAAAEDTASSIEQMLASIKQVSENTETLSASAEQTSSSITEMSSTVKEVEQRALEAAQLAERVSIEASDRGMTAAKEAIRGMNNIKETVEATADVVNRLGKRSQEIGQILKVIDEVTDQTSLLALNAAILAAQAGEHGKGFAVVAEEIKDLAERTAASTQEITSLIVAVREETEQSMKAMDRGLKAVETGSSLVQVVSDVLQQVTDSSKQSADMAHAIEKTTAEQTRGISQITEAAVSIASQIEQIASAMQEQRRGSERIANASEKMRDITRQMKSATQEQTTGSRHIANTIDSVKTQAALVARSTSEQNIGAQQISNAVNRIQKITRENVDVSVEMDMAVQRLKSRADALQVELEGFRL
jgi:methyl-accepting chemotaxis protein